MLVAAWQLFVLTDHTDRFFAWTIAMPLTAAVDGAFYLGGFLPVVPLGAGPHVDQVKPISLGVLAVSTLKLVATLLHLDLFHFSAGEATARIAAWGWLVVYVAVPVVLGSLIAAELRAGERPAGDAPHASGAARRRRPARRRPAGRRRLPVDRSVHGGRALALAPDGPHRAGTLRVVRGVGIVAALVVPTGTGSVRNVWMAAVVLAALQGVALLRYGRRRLGLALGVGVRGAVRARGPRLRVGGLVAGARKATPTPEAGHQRPQRQPEDEERCDGEDLPAVRSSSIPRASTWATTSTISGEQRAVEGVQERRERVRGHRISPRTTCSTRIACSTPRRPPEPAVRLALERTTRSPPRDQDEPPADDDEPDVLVDLATADGIGPAARR